MLPTNRPALVKMIRDAFDGNVYPGDGNIFEDIYDPDIDSWRELLLGVSWEEALGKLEALVGTDQNYYETMVYFMTTEALHYYTPMYLILAMDPDSQALPGAFIFSLPPEHNNLVLSLYTPEQKQVIALTLQECFREMDEDFDEALKKFWFQFLPG